MRRLPIVTILLLILGSSFYIYGCDDGSDARFRDYDLPGTDLTVLEQLEANEDFSLFVDLIGQAGMRGMLNEQTNYTVFAPRNEVLEEQQFLLATISNNQRRQIVRYHILRGDVRASEFQDGDVKNAIGPDGSTGEELYFSRNDNNEIFVNRLGRITSPNRRAINGRVHVINRLLIPDNMNDVRQNINKRPFLHEMRVLINNVGLLQTLEESGPFTVFAARNQAFVNQATALNNLSDDELREVVEYHIVPQRLTRSDHLTGSGSVTTLAGRDIAYRRAGGTVVLNDKAIVIMSEAIGTNGVVHVIDRILDVEVTNDVVESIGALDELSMFNDLLNETGVGNELSDQPEVTVFAPTNAAMQQLDIFLAGLTMNEKRTFVRYHFLDKIRDAESLNQNMAIQTYQGGSIFLTVDSQGNPTINQTANVLSTDIEATNGFIHTIDDALIADLLGRIPANINKRYQITSLADALRNVGLMSELDQQGPFTVFAPVNQVFDEADFTGMSTDQIRDALNYHIVPGNFTSTDGLQSDTELTTRNNRVIDVQNLNGLILLNEDTRVISADAIGRNGVIHLVDGVLNPDANLGVAQQLAFIDDVSMFYDLLVSEGLKEELNAKTSLTAFPPVNSVMDDLEIFIAGLTTEERRDFIMHHFVEQVFTSNQLQTNRTLTMVSGQLAFAAPDGDGQARLNRTASIVEPDRQGTNGRIHTLDGALIPDSFDTVPENVGKRHMLTMLNSLMIETGLDAELSANGPYTLFAPVNQAFSAFADEIAELTPQEVEDLLRYHVVQDMLTSSDGLDETTELTSINGFTIEFERLNNLLVLNGSARVIARDAISENGVIHIIDEVLEIPDDNNNGNGNGNGD